MIRGLVLLTFVSLNVTWCCEGLLESVEAAVWSERVCSIETERCPHLLGYIL